jgi:hypothetical protein
MIDKAIFIYSLTVINMLFLLTSRPTLANSINLKSLKILHPTINTHWLSRGKFQVFRIFTNRLLISIAFLNNG